MKKCDICGDKAKRRLFITNIEKGETNCGAEICEKCEAELAEAIVAIANRRMREKYGDKALTIPDKPISTRQKRSDKE